MPSVAASAAFFSTAYGLTLRSNQPVPGARAQQDAARADLTIRFAELPDWAADASDAPGRHRLEYPDRTRFHIDLRAATIFANWSAPLTLEDTATYLLGPVLGFYLRLLGHVCLHGSAVLLEGRCHAFVGPAGSGKSTLAAAFAARGVPVLTEDVACIDETGGVLAVRPGYPRIRLWEDSARRLAAVGSDLPLLTPNWEKRFLELDGARPFADAPAPVAAVYVLEQRRAMDAPAALAPYAGQAALTRLLANTYGKRLVDGAMRAHEFAVLGRLAQSVPVRGLTLADDGARLPDACDWIRTHALA